MSPTMEKVIIIGAGREGLAAADYIKSNTEFKYKIIEKSFSSECDKDAKGKHGKNLKLNEKVTSAKMNKKMEHWVVMTEKIDDQKGSVTKTKYKCDGGIIVTTRNPCNVPEWVKERIIFNEGKVMDFEFKKISTYLTKCKFFSIGFEEEDRLHTRNSYLEISEHEFFWGNIIVGAGPAGLATAASFDTLGGGSIKYKIIEKSKHIAPLWQDHTYEKLTLQRPKDKCQLLPNKPFPEACPAYPTRENFLQYLREIYENLKVTPQFGEEVTKAYYIDESDRLIDGYEDNSHWVVRTIKKLNQDDDDKRVRSEYKCTGLVVASGRDARPRVPEFVGLKEHFPRETNASLKKQIHASEYSNGVDYKDKKVLVVGYGDSAIDICGDLHNEGATPYIAVRKGDRSRMVYKLAELFPGKEHPATFPMKLKLSLLSVLVNNFGQCKTGIIDPKEEIEIDVYPDIEKFEKGSVKFKNVDGHLPIDCVILATGYNDNVRLWCQEKISFQKERKELQELELKDSKRNRVLRVGFSIDGLLGIKGQAISAAKFGEDEEVW